MIPPRATYRVQLNKDFTFAAATGIVDRLAVLGISHLYVSPFLKARAGSLHGYDIIDHNTLNPEIGGEAELVALSDKLAAHGMGLILDIVPNHMGVGGSDNAWWLDVLEWGEASPYAAWFDIDWEARRADLRGKVLLPVLGDQYGIVLEHGEIALRFEPAQGSFSAWYYDHRFPIAPGTYPDILSQAADADMRALAEEFGRLGNGNGASAEDRVRSHEEGTRLKAGLAALTARRPESVALLEAAAARFTGTPEDPSSWRPLHTLLDRQSYRLAYWRAAADEINYRRFFNINDLAGIRVEEPGLFVHVHRRILQLVADKRLSGLRIDHIDGLYDPRGYCQRLQREASAAAGVAEGDYYIVVEKILAAHEALRDWPIAGTTGYDFTNEVLGLFIDPAGERPLSRIYRRFTRRTAPYAEVLDQSKRRITDVNLASEMNVLARAFHALAMSNWRSRDFTLNGMRRALEEVVATFPVYRTYVTEEGASAEDGRYIDWAVGQARRRWPGTDSSIIDFVHRVLSTDLARDGAYSREEVLRVAMKFQQVTGPVMAKGAEDTAFYRYLRLIALNEVGGDPSRFGLSVAAFHRICEARAKGWPAAMLASATHDTKRGEDARARLALLSEMPRQWDARVQRWARLNRLRRGEIEGAPAPDRNDEYFFYQTLVGAWPPDLTPEDVAGIADFAARVSATMVKLGREAKERSSWSNPNAAYEASVARFVAGALDAAKPNPFLRDVHAYVETLARPGAVNALAQTLLKLTAPGVPDIFQGCELWDFSMVDPDNRRPVDWVLHRRLLDELHRHPADRPVDRDAFAGWIAEWRDGREKLFLIWRALALRAAEPALFAGGGYLPLAASGRHAERLCAFARMFDGRAIVTVAPRLVAAAAPEGEAIDWADTIVALPPGRRWRCALTGRDISAGEEVAAAELFAAFPVALLAGA